MTALKTLIRSGYTSACSILPLGTLSEEGAESAETENFDVSLENIDIEPKNNDLC